MFKSKRGHAKSTSIETDTQPAAIQITRRLHMKGVLS
jgi:hypothetical protein